MFACHLPVLDSCFSCFSCFFFAVFSRFFVLPVGRNITAFASTGVVRIRCVLFSMFFFIYFTIFFFSFFPFFVSLFPLACVGAYVTLL